MRNSEFEHHSTDKQFSQQADQVAIAVACRGILETLPTAAYTCDEVGLITYFNPIAASVWGRTPKLRDAGDRYCGSHRMYSRDGNLIPHGQCWMALALQHGAAYHAREIVIEREDGTRKVALAHAHPLRNRRGAVVGALNLFAELGGNTVDGSMTRLPAVADAATVAIIDIAVSVLTVMPWDGVSVN